MLSRLLRCNALEAKEKCVPGRVLAGNASMITSDSYTTINRAGKLSLMSITNNTFYLASVIETRQPDGVS